jgi:lipopolysaccharide/colanic/teichoic acid biosynthesis glycosyltransferase
MLTLRKLVSIRIYLLSFFEAILVAGCYTLALFLCQPVDAQTYLEYEGGALRIAVVAIAFLITAYIFDFYRQPHTTSRILLALQLCQLIGIVLLIHAAMGFVNTELILPQPVILVASALMMILLVLWRIFVRPAVWAAFGAQRVVFIGSSEAVEELAFAFTTEPVRGMEVAGYIVEPGAKVRGKVLGGPDQLLEIISEIAPDRIIVDSSLTHKGLLRDLLELKVSGASVETASQAYESAFGRLDCRGLHPYTVVFLDDLRAPASGVALQSIYTNVLGLIATIVSVPLLIIVAIVLKITRSGPVFTSYLCTGLHGIPFKLYRFDCPDGTGFMNRLLSRYKVAGFPQVLNLVRGEIALIGPRPERVEFDRELCQLIPFYPQKHSAKPGIFGWSQLHCDPESEERTLRRLEYDLYYIKHISVPLDIYIVLRAVKSILSDQAPRQRKTIAPELATTSK